MKPKDPLIINVNVDWRVLLILGVVTAVLALTYAAAVAQDNDAPDTNSVQVEEAVAAQHDTAVEQEESTWPPKPEGDFVPTTNYEWIPAAESEAAPLSAAEAGETTASGTVRHIYLTKANYRPNQAKSACAAGYRMASFWEIFDISNVIYDYNHPQAYVKTDSGQGPPSYWHGWVRTGYDSSGSSTTGTGNCLNWTSSSAGDYGVSVRLSRTWETAPGDIGTWDANEFTCNITGPVWCVRN
jgi:hypothetical protein